SLITLESIKKFCPRLFLKVKWCLSSISLVRPIVAICFISYSLPALLIFLQLFQVRCCSGSVFFAAELRSHNQYSAVPLNTRVVLSLVNCPINGNTAYPELLSVPL